MSNERAISNREADERIVAAEGLLGEHATMAIATADADGPWIARVFFVDDEPAPGRLDLCCAVAVGTDRARAVAANPSVAFFVGGDDPKRWATGRGVLRPVEDDADAAAIVKRLRDGSEHAATFLDRVAPTPVRINVERLVVTDLSTDPPVTEFTFA